MGFCMYCKFREETLPGLYQCKNEHSQKYKDDVKDHSTCQGFQNIIQSTKQEDKQKDINLIAERIKLAMGKNFTTKSLSEHCDVRYSAMREILSAEHAPSVSTIISIARVLNVSIDWLCGLRENINE